MKPFHTGFNLAIERAAQDGTEYQVGAGEIPCIAEVPLADRQTCLPLGEEQFGVEDFMDCATRGPVNGFEEKFTYLLWNKKLTPDNENWLLTNGYIVGNRVELSDRFNAILSSTTRSGNSLKGPIDSCRNDGMIPKSMLPKGKDMTWEQYHNRNDTTQKMIDLGQEFRRRFLLNYQQVPRSQFDQYLERDGLCTAGFAWPAPVAGEYGPSDALPNHAFWTFKNQYYAFDNYRDSVDGDYIKKLTPTYKFLDYGYRLIIRKQTTEEERKFIMTVFEVFKRYGFLAFFEKFLALLGKKLGLWKPL